MTATTSARVISTTACSSWCDPPHPEGTSLHSRDLAGTWGSVIDGPVLGLALEREGSKAPKINVQLSHDGIVMDDGLSLGLAAAEDYAVAILRLVDAGRADL